MKASIVIAGTLSVAAAFPITFPAWTPPLSIGLGEGAGDNSLRLVKLGPQEYSIVSENDKLAMKRSKINFMDVTNQYSIEEAVERGWVNAPSTSLWFTKWGKQVEWIKNEVKVYNYPKSAEHESTVTKLFKSIDKNLLFENLATFTSFYTRYYKSESGLDSANWLHEQLEALVAPVRENVTITKVHHADWDQYSIIVSIPGEVTDKVVVGAHQDSINLLFPNVLKAPGADDDGSGTVTTLEAFRILIAEYAAGTFKPYNTLEFHYYSAEEGGLLGSGDVFARYAASNETVVGMLQQDMTGSTKRTIENGIEPHFGLISDHTSVHLNNFLKVIINTYNNIPFHETECGYSCSDHASALENGYPSSFLIESEMKYSSTFIHSVLDTIDRIDWDHVEEHVKLTIAYAYELSLASKL